MVCTTTASPLTGKPQQLSQLGSGRVPARGLVYEDPVQDLSVELAFLVLVQGAYAHVSDPLSTQQSSRVRIPASPLVRQRSSSETEVQANCGLYAKSR
jgi:hypothetical protein